MIPVLVLTPLASARVPTLLGFLPLGVLLVLTLQREVVRARERSPRTQAADRVLLLSAAPLLLAFVLFAGLNVLLNLG